MSRIAKYLNKFLVLPKNRILIFPVHWIVERTHAFQEKIIEMDQI